MDSLLENRASDNDAAFLISAPAGPQPARSSEWIQAGLLRVHWRPDPRWSGWRPRSHRLELLRQQRGQFTGDGGFVGSESLPANARLYFPPDDAQSKPSQGVLGVLVWGQEETPKPGQIQVLGTGDALGGAQGPSPGGMRSAATPVRPGAPSPASACLCVLPNYCLMQNA